MATLKSKIINKRDIDWSQTIKLSELKIDSKTIEYHKQRINNVFSQLPENARQQHLHNIILRDNLFTKAMDNIVTYYDIEYDKDDIENIKSNLLKIHDDIEKENIELIVKKIISKALIFHDLQATYNIAITDDEMMNILHEYYQNTNQPIRDFMEDNDKFEKAKNTILEEKTVAFIIDKFPKDLSELEQKLKNIIDKKKNHDK